MEEHVDPPRTAHKKSATSVGAASSNTSESLRARQLDRLATRSKLPAKLPLSVKAKGKGRDSTGISVTTTAVENSKLRNSTTSPRKANASKVSNNLKSHGTLSSAAAQRLTNRTLGSEKGTMHSRGNGSSGENKLMDDTLGSGKEGRSFTVGKVGGGGKIYLRPSARPAHHLYQQPNFRFPTRPSTKNGPEDSLLADNEGDDDQRDSIWTYQSRSTTPLREHATLRPNQHARAYSHSTIDEHAVQDWDVGAFKVVIDRPSADGRPKTSGGTHSSFPTLEVPIPSYKIGTPRFSVRGTPFIRGSSYAPTEADNRTSIMSKSQRESSFMGLKRDSRSFHPANPFRHSVASFLPADQASVFELRLPPTGLTGQTPNLMPRQAIVPEMFDSISTLPMCEDRSVVRRNLAGQISAATPARLIVEVTKELNYELVASVFITYRSYVTASDLLSLVMARLQHGINQGDQGLVVTVRCFTVIRHWLVNFFIDDFVLDYNLRVEFCELVNHMVQRHAERMTNSKTTNDILSNIKRLWRDSGSTYWDGPEFDIDSDALVPIYPGGVAGSRDPKLTPETFAEILRSRSPRSEMGDLSILSKPPILELDLDNSINTSNQRFFSSASIEQSRQQQESSQKSGSTTRGHKLRPSISERPMSPRSIASVDAFSCSFPLKAGQLASAVGVGAHPVSTTASSVAASSPTVRAPKIIRSNSQRGPRRNRSVSNSSRPERPFSADLQSPSSQEHELYMTDRFAGSLIRGLVFLPPVDLYLPAEETPTSRPSSVPDKRDSSNKHEPTQSSGNGKGKKKMFGTVRRAVNKSEVGDKPHHHLSHPHLSMALEQTAAVGCAAGAAVVKQCFRGQSIEVRMRLDKLSQFVERDFEAIVEQHRAELDEADKRGDGEDAKSFGFGKEPRLSTIKLSSSEQLPGLGLTSQSKDGPPQFESFPAFKPNRGSSSNGNLAPSLPPPIPGSSLIEASWQASSTPTPPVTPPDRIQGNSQNLGEYASTADRTPSLVLGLRSPASLESQPSFRPLRHPTAAQRERKGSRSASIRRIASFHSGYTREQAKRSFDATTFSAERTSAGSTHAPGNRVLRRRPGGDLRAVKRVNDLPLRRYRSTSSLSTYDASLRSSFRLGSTESASGGYLNVSSAQEDSRPFSVGALADPDGTSKPKALSLYSTDSKPVMRASFQAEAAKLAEIPDDADDDGGVESALLKLEGKYEQRRSQTSTQGLTEDFSRSSEIEFERMFDQPSEDSTVTEKNLPRHSTGFGTLSVNEKHELEVYVDDVTPTGGERVVSSGQDSMYNEIPLLQRNSTFSIYATKPLDRTLNSFEEARNGRMDESQNSYSRSQESIDIVNKTDSMMNIPAGETLPRHFSNKGSYIEVEHNGDHSDLSSEMSLEMLSSQDFSTSAFLNKPSPYNQQSKPITELPIPHSKASQNSGLTMQHALGLLPSRDTYPPTPQGTPTIPPPPSHPTMQSWYSGNEQQNVENPTVEQQFHADGGQIIDDHYPFILSFPATLLAQQFTLVEMEALSEIHFRELLEMKWSHDTASSCRSWPKFLQKLSKVEEDDSVSHGIEICAARSSIMASWAISQVVLTTKLEERAKTVAKLINVANECRKMGNYATLFQLTVALTNPLLTELRQTWQQVPSADIAILRDLEAVIQPANNFRKLRDEMESVLGKRACIPLVAIYAKDLSALKDMPSYIASTLSEPPLINVTKCKAQAAVVQLVARYLEKSGEMRIKPVQDVVARCLWIGGLRDAEVKECARGLV